MKKYLAFVFCASLVLVACKKDPKIIESQDSAFSAVLTNYAPKITGQYAELSSQTNSLLNLANSFVVSGELNDFNLVQEQLKNCRKQWFNVSMFDFGPAESNDLRLSINTFPIDTAAVSLAIESENFSSLAFDEKGFLAIEWLLHRSNAFELFTDGINDAQEYDALIWYCTDINSRVANVHEIWMNSYQSAFASNTGASAGSGMSLLVNGYIQDYERLKRQRLALPLGLLTLGIPLESHVEAPYGGYSAELMQSQFVSSLLFYQGWDQAVENGYGLDDAIASVNATWGEESTPLESVILQRFNEAQLALSSLNDPFRN
ncbi:MAG: imelysin family protein, partial [Flavobacteriales bacterium]